MNKYEVPVTTVEMAKMPNKVNIPLMAAPNPNLWAFLTIKVNAYHAALKKHTLVSAI